MNENEIKKNEEMEIDLGRLVREVLDRTRTVILITVLGAVLAFLITGLFIKPKYQSSAMFYVNNNALSVGDASFSISSGDLLTSRNLVDSYIVILKTRETLLEVIDYAEVDLSCSELRNMISAQSVNSTEIFQISVTSTDPVEATELAHAIANILPKRISTIIDGTSAKVVDAAVVPSSPSSPSYPKNTIIGAIIGFVLVVAVIVLREIFDITIRNEDDITQCCKHPILAAVPNMTAPSKGGSYYSSDGKAAKKHRKGGAYAQGSKQPQKRPGIMGAEVNFAASEAYKLLRTKLQFSFADDDGCRVIGLSSALSGEGKSLTAVNLAYTLSQLDKKVILIDCDMRRPTLAEKLGILKIPGLSSYLTGQCHLNELLQMCNLRNNEQAFHVITAGQNPPNPVELLSSEKMEIALGTLRQYYDYVILDLPPVGEVTDAMAVAKKTDGMLLVVRQNYCDRIALTDAVRQFAFINAKILGVVVNCVVETGIGYGKSYYKRYYKYSKYASKNASSYANNDRKVAEKSKVVGREDVAERKNKESEVKK